MREARMSPSIYRVSHFSNAACLNHMRSKAIISWQEKSLSLIYNCHHLADNTSIWILFDALGIVIRVHRRIVSSVGLDKLQNRVRWWCCCCCWIFLLLFLLLLFFFGLFFLGFLCLGFFLLGLFFLCRLLFLGFLFHGRLLLLRLRLFRWPYCDDICRPIFSQFGGYTYRINCSYHGHFLSLHVHGNGINS
ncbi:hypothetical protein OIU84_012458, partial [Salix udensis]